MAIPAAPPSHGSWSSRGDIPTLSTFVTDTDPIDTVEADNAYRQNLLDSIQRFMIHTRRDRYNIKCMLNIFRNIIYEHDPYDIFAIGYTHFEKSVVPYEEFITEVVYHVGMFRHSFERVNPNEWRMFGREYLFQTSEYIFMTFYAAMLSDVLDTL